MDGFLDTLIWIIIAISGIIVSMINKKSKEDRVKKEFPEFNEEPEPQQTSDNYFQTGITSLDDYLNKAFAQEEEGEEGIGETELDEGQSDVQERKQALLDADNTGIYLDKKDNSEDNTKYKHINQDEVTTRQEPISSILKRFRDDPRQAVVLGEIINRKHF